MLRIQQQRRRGSTDSSGSSNGNGDEYSERDRQRIAAETDAAIADVRAMGPSAFATGHLPNDKNVEPRPDTGDGDEATASPSSRSTPWRNPKKARKKKRPKKHMRNKALIVNHSWGGPIQGGVTDGVHLLFRLLRELGLSVYCTTLTATEEEIEEAKEFGVELIVPSPLPRFKVRDRTPEADWLYFHKGFFPTLKELANVRFVFGLGMITSEAAFEIQRDLFKRTAALYLINMFDKDTIDPVIACCDRRELDLRRKNILKEGQDSSSVFSVGGGIFKRYKKKCYRKDPQIKHYRLSPIVDENHFKIPSPESVDDDEEFQILSLFQEHELAYLTSDSTIVKAINSVAESFCLMQKSSLKWKILGVPNLCESDLKNRINPHSHVDIIPARMPSAEELNDELGQSNLVLIHPYSVHYVNLTLAAMSAAVPIIVPKRSLSHELIKAHVRDYEDKLVVDMSKSDDLKTRISEYLCQYEITLTRANKIKSEIERKVKQELENINNDFFRVVQDDAEIKYGITLEREKRVVKKTQANEKSKEVQKKEPHKYSLKRKLQERDSGDIKLKVRLSEVVPQEGKTVKEVQRGFYKSSEVKEKTEEISEILNEQHYAMHVKDHGDGSILYLMSCQSLDALECLMVNYEKGRLQDLMEDKFLSEKLLEKIGAFHLAIDVTIDYEEYFLCRKEFIKKHGRSSRANNTPKVQPAIPHMTGKTSGRVNRARALLKAFETEGDQVTERQINMLDQLLQEKEERRRKEHQLSMPESEEQTFKQQNQVDLISKEFVHQPLLMQVPDDTAFTQMSGFHKLADEEIEEKNEELAANVNNLATSSGIRKSWNRKRGQDRDILKSMVLEREKASAHEIFPLFSQFLQVKTEEQDPELLLKTEKLSVHADDIVHEAEIPQETKEVYLDVRQVERGYPVKGSVLELFGDGSMPGQFDGAEGIYIKNNGQWVICDRWNERVQVIDPIKLCCDLILQFHAFPEPFNPWNVTVDEENDKYFMSDYDNGQVLVSSGQSKILKCFGRKEGIKPRGICLSDDAYIYVGDNNGYVRKYKQSGEHIARTEKGQVKVPYGLIVNKECIFVLDYDNDRKCVHVLNHQLQSIRDIGKGYLQSPYGLCFDHKQDGIYVCDYWGGRVVHFRSNGEFLSYIGEGQLEEPRHISLCKGNPYRLVVTQSDCIKLLYI